MAESRAEIDTAAPFASVKDALNIFGEGSCTRRMASLEAELHLAHIELAKLKEQLAASESNKDLCTLNEQLHDESTCHLEEKENLQEDLFPAAEDGNDSWQAQLDAALEQQRNTDDQETVRKEIELLQAELDVVNREYASTAANLACALNDIQSLREGMQGLIDAKALAEGQAGHFSTVAEMSAKRVDELTKDLSAMEESLSKANESRMEAEREFRTTLAAESKRLAAVANNAAAEVANLDEKVKETEAKLVSAIADLEKMEQELSSTKEREQNALKAEVAANLNLQRMKIDVEDAKVATEKVPDKSASLGHTVVEASAIQLEDTNAKLKKATEQETCLLASLASLKAELRNMSAELLNAKRETEDANARVEEVKNQSCAALETAALEEAKTKESLSSSMAALQQVTAQAEEAKAAAAEAIKDSVKLRQELEQAMAHTSTLESRLQAALMETEAARASEAMALQEIKYIKEKESTNRDNVQAGQEVTHSHEEYEVLTRKMHEAEELANKRVAAAIAQADAAKAVEREMQSKMDAARKLIECSQTAMREAIERAEAAEAAKSAVEGELRRWRDDGEQRHKAAVEAVIQAVSRNGAVKSNIANGSSKTLESTRSLSYAMSQNSNSTIIKDQEAPETLAQALQHKFPGENKAKKNIFVTKFGPYFYKKIK
ncbi:unnamed protein product [Sphagnum troendelagicum]|uniref:WEB family protein n=1 Tax=Sphagnum troendelagicum TaxID=128251 RepID=A0ABP0T7L1_9BRYO